MPFVSLFKVRRSVTVSFTSNPNHETILPAISSLLSSGAANDTISEQLAELLGFDDLDLVMELLEKREAMKVSVSVLVRLKLSGNC